MRPKRIDHVAIATHDLADTRDLFVRLFGFSVVDEPAELEDQGVAVQFLSCGDWKVELIAPTRDEGPLVDFLRNRGPGLYHICLEVDDADSALSELREKGVRLATKKPFKTPHGLAAFVHPKAANGVSIELRQFLSPKSQEPAGRSESNLRREDTQ